MDPSQVPINDVQSLESTTKKILEQIESQPSSKNETKSNIIKQIGDHKCVAKEYMDALEAYNEALCLAPINSESICSIYARRADIYLDTGFYSFCLENIKQALHNNYCPEHLKGKLLEQEDICKKKMTKEKDSIDLYGTPIKTDLSHPPNPKIPCVDNRLRCETNAEFGRHIVTNRDLKPGDIVLIEEPFFKTLDLKSSYAFCYNCGEHNFYNLWPCIKSTTVMFCSPTCVVDAWVRFYKYESHVIHLLTNSNLPENLHFGFRTTLQAFTMVEDLEELKNLIESIDVNAENAFKLDWTKADERDKFRALYSLATLEAELPVGSIEPFEKALEMFLSRACKQSGFKTLLRNEEHEKLFLKMWKRFCLISQYNSCPLVGQFMLDKTKKLLRTNGRGIYLLYSLLNHSCCPNVRWEVAEDKRALIVIRKIKAGEQLFVSYGVKYNTHSIEYRKKWLSYFYCFDCKCEACKNNLVQKDVSIIPKQISAQLAVFEQFQFDKQMINLANKLQRLIPDAIERGQKYFPCKEISDLENLLICCKIVLMNRKPVNLMLEAKEVIKETKVKKAKKKECPRC